MFNTKEKNKINFDDLVSKATSNIEKSESKMKKFKNFFKENYVKPLLEEDTISANASYEIMREMTDSFMRHVSIYQRYHLWNKFALFIAIVVCVSGLLLGWGFLSLFISAFVGVSMYAFNNFYSLKHQTKNREDFKKYLKNYPIVLSDNTLSINKMFFAALAGNDVEINKKLKMEINNQIGSAVMLIDNDKDWNLEKWVEAFDSIHKKITAIRKIEMEKEKGSVSDDFNFDVRY